MEFTQNYGNGCAYAVTGGFFMNDNMNKNPHESVSLI